MTSNENEARFSEDTVAEELAAEEQEQEVTPTTGATAATPPVSGDSYTDDDELMLNDEVLHEDNSSALVKQLDNVVTWEVENLYNERGKPRNRLALRTDPPLLKITSSAGDYAEFVLTKSLASTLERACSDVQKAYAGVDPTVRTKLFSQEGFKEKVASGQSWLMDNKIKAVLILGFFILMVISLFLTH